MENNENKINIEENKKESKEQIALNNKKKIIFLNSFSTEPISEKQKEEKE
jgi:hypothetical protein